MSITPGQNNHSTTLTEEKQKFNFNFRSDALRTEITLSQLHALNSNQNGWSLLVVDSESSPPPPPPPPPGTHPRPNPTSRKCTSAVHRERTCGYPRREERPEECSIIWFNQRVTSFSALRSVDASLSWNWSTVLGREFELGSLVSKSFLSRQDVDEVLS